jgi:phage repressor protein C with HTH and peptisase S24 domain
MSGSSMEPTIHDGAIIGIEYGVLRFRSGKIHVLWIPGEGPIVRRVFVDIEKVVLKADNPQFPDITIETENIPKEQFNLGCVGWVLQAL